MGNGCKVLTNRLPAWVELVKGKPVLVPDRAAAVKRIFDLAANGYGIHSIVARLTAEGVEPFGSSGAWTRSYVGLILKDRRALGELQMRRGRDHDGEAVVGYYPAVVTEAEWLAARAGAKQRGGGRVRTGKRAVNIFAGLIRNARDGDSYMMTQRQSRTGGKLLRQYPILVNNSGDNGRGKRHTIPYLPVERAVLSRLRELDARAVLNGDHAPDESHALAGELAGVEAELAAAESFMEANGFSPAIGKRVRTLEARKRELGERLAEARQKAAHPLSESWGEAQSLVDALDAAADKNDVRLRLRAALKRICESVWLLVVNHGKDALAAIRVQFTGGKHRDYLLLYRPARNRHVDARFQVKDFADAAPTVARLDLRRPKDAAKVAAFLERLDLSGLAN
jgi:hypothetical protein